MPGALAGVWLLDRLRDSIGDDFDTFMLLSIGGVLLLTGALVLLRALALADMAARERGAFRMKTRHKIAAVALGASVGFVLGITSAGSGTLIAIGLILGFRLSPHRVVGTDVAHAAVLLWVAALAHVVSGNVDYGLAGTLLIGSLPGVWLGTHVSTKMPQDLLRGALGVVLLASGLGLLSKAGLDVPVFILAGFPVVLAVVVFLLLRRRGARGGARVRATATHLQVLEAEAIHVIREVAAELERPVLLFSGGKDSIVLLRLAEKAFRPGEVPFGVMHVDTGHNFPEAIEFRDRRVPDVLVASVQESIDRGRVLDEPSRNRLQTTTLLDAIEEHRFDAAFGGARRDEERARAKERIFSFRDDFGQWDPRRQRPELWNLYNGRVRPGEHVRVFPISNWTELDVWEYIRTEDLEIPSIYFAHEREVFERDGMLYAASEFLPPRDGEAVFTASVRYRTVGDMTCTGAVRSEAATLDDVIAEIAATRISERGETRADDRTSEAAMEDRKREGYF